MREAIGIAHAAGRKVAFTLSDAFCISRHRADFLNLLESGAIDILFANEVELQSLTEIDNFDTALAKIAAKVPTLVVTRGAHGAVAVQGGEHAAVSAEPIERIVDTTGAGDLFAAGFMTGQVQGRSLEQSLRMGAIAAAEIISHYGARPEAKLDELMREKLD
jgi:sugar/nucleoside kinase (ribokinase family)